MLRLRFSVSKFAQVWKAWGAHGVEGGVEQRRKELVAAGEGWRRGILWSRLWKQVPGCSFSGQWRDTCVKHIKLLLLDTWRHFDLGVDHVAVNPLPVAAYLCRSHVFESPLFWYMMTHLSGSRRAACEFDVLQVSPQTPGGCSYPSPYGHPRSHISLNFAGIGGLRGPRAN